MNTSEVLNKAADLIQERGWVRGVFGWGDMDPASGLCLEGGIAAAANVQGKYVSGTVKDCPAYQAVRAHLGEETVPWIWNDNPQRTEAEVIGVLRACAVIEAAREEQDAAYATYADQVSA